MLAELKAAYEKQEKSLKTLLEAASIYHRVLLLEQESIPPEILEAFGTHKANVLQAVNVFEFWWRLSVQELNVLNTGGR